VPGLARTLTVSTLSHVVGGRFARIQFTPDLVPTDLVGTRIWRGVGARLDLRQIGRDLGFTTETKDLTATVAAAALVIALMAAAGALLWTQRQV